MPESVKPIHVLGAQLVLLATSCSCAYFSSSGDLESDPDALQPILTRDGESYLEFDMEEGPELIAPGAGGMGGRRYLFRPPPGKGQVFDRDGRLLYTFTHVILEDRPRAPTISMFSLTMAVRNSIVRASFPVTVKFFENKTFRLKYEFGLNSEVDCGTGSRTTRREAGYNEGTFDNLGRVTLYSGLLKGRYCKSSR